MFRSNFDMDDHQVGLASYWVSIRRPGAVVPLVCVVQQQIVGVIYELAPCVDLPPVPQP
jgi:hypothetical protein